MRPGHSASVRRLTRGLYSHEKVHTSFAYGTWCLTTYLGYLLRTLLNLPMSGRLPVTWAPISRSPDGIMIVGLGSRVEGALALHEWAVSSPRRCPNPALMVDGVYRSQTARDGGSVSPCAAARGAWYTGLGAAAAFRMRMPGSPRQCVVSPPYPVASPARRRERERAAVGACIWLPAEPLTSSMSIHAYLGT